MKLKSYETPEKCSKELETLLTTLEEISIQLRQVLEIPQAMVLSLDVHAEHASETEALELESRKRAILGDIVKTEEAIDSMNREISAMLRIGWNLSAPTRPRDKNHQIPNRVSGSLLEH